ncbi:MAG TPA: class I SAM-dependent methyltransferase [Rhizomicrobium sp.]|nr:class I SAM-dependent methyltransferase [Rhizomicrobium sp.]
MTDQQGRPDFAGAAAHYRRYRLAYPQRLIARVAALAGLKPRDAVLDLGCGTGMLAIPFAQAGMAVTAMDPEPEMLAAAQMGAQEAGVAVTWIRGGSQDLTAHMGPFRLVVMGRSFHWMDRARTLAMLDQIVTPDGGVALFHDSHPPVAENGWFKILCDAQEKHRRQAGAAAREGGHKRYEPFLFASAFSQLDGLSVTVRHALGLEDIVGRALSMSQNAGAGQETLAARLEAALREWAPDGKFVEVAELVAVLARRPKE